MHQLHLSQPFTKNVDDFDGNIVFNDLSNFIEITLGHGCSPVNLLHIFRIPFPKNTCGRLLLTFYNLSCNFLKNFLFLLKDLFSQTQFSISGHEWARLFRAKIKRSEADCCRYFPK